MMKKLYFLFFTVIYISLTILLPACSQSDDAAEEGSQLLAQPALEQVHYISEPVTVFGDYRYALSFGTIFLFDNHIVFPYVETALGYSEEHRDYFAGGISIGRHFEETTEINLSGERRVVGVDAFYGEDFFTIPFLTIGTFDLELAVDDFIGWHSFERGDIVRILAAGMDDYDETRGINLLVNVFSEDSADALLFYRLCLDGWIDRFVEHEVDLSLIGGSYRSASNAWFDANGNALLLTHDMHTQRLVVLDSTLTQRLAHFDVGMVTALTIDPDGFIWVVEETRYGAPTSTLRRLNPENWSWEESLTLQIYNVFGLHDAPASDDFKLFAHTQFGLYGITPSGEVIEYLSWVDVGVQVTWDTTLLFRENGEILVLNEDPDPFDDSWFTIDAVALRPAEGVVTDEREVLTIGGVGISNDRVLLNTIRRFNRESETHRAVIVDYAAHGEWHGVSMRLRADLISGGGTDIIIFNQWGDENDITSALMRGDWLSDLNVFLENDHILSREDFFENILDIWTNDAGELTLITGAVRPMPFWGPGDLLAHFTDFTHEGFLEFLRDSEAQGVPHPMGINFLPKLALQTMLFADNTFFCFTSGTAYFDSDLFLEILYYIDSIPHERQARWIEAMDTGEAWNPVALISRGEQLMTNMFGFMMVDDFRVFDAAVGGLIPIGAPNAAGGLSIATMPITRIGISADSSSTDAAWEFIRLSILYPYEYAIEGLPIRRSIFEDDINSTIAEGASLSGGLFGFAEGEEIPPLTEERAAILRLIMESITHEYHPDPHILAIVWEEVEPFLAGIRSAEDAARIIQSRAAIYLAERT